MVKESLKANVKENLQIIIFEETRAVEKAKEQLQGVLRRTRNENYAEIHGASSYEELSFFLSQRYRYSMICIGARVQATDSILGIVGPQVEWGIFDTTTRRFFRTKKETPYSSLGPSISSITCEIQRRQYQERTGNKWGLL